MFANSYTQERILRGLRIVWREALDYDDPLHPDMNFMEEFIPGGRFAEIDFGDVVYRIQRVFGFTCTGDEWKVFLGLHIEEPDEWNRDIAPQLTFRALADFIRKHLKPISFEPIALLGKPCLTAGVFRGLEQLVGQIHPKVTRFAPSTPIRTRLRGFRLHRFWCRLRWIVGDQLPPPPQINFPSRGFLSSLFAKLSIVLLIALLNRDLKGLLQGFVVTVVLFIPIGVIVAYINERLNPLPREIQTFGDLARVLGAIIMDQQTEATSCSIL